MPDTCYVAECDRPAARGGLCWGHVKRKQRQQRIGRVLQERENYDTPLGRLVVAACELADCAASDDAGWDRRRDRIRKAAKAYVASLGTLSTPEHFR